VKRRLTSAFIVFAYFTAIGLMFFGYRYLEYVANREAVSPLEPFINEVLTGAWMAAVLFPLVARFARRYPLDRFNWAARLPLHAGALAVYSLAHTSLLWVLRNTLYPLFGLRRYDYGDMTARYPMEFFHDVIAYTIIVSLLHLFDRQVRAAQLEAQLAHARLENLRLQLQPHFLFNALHTVSALVHVDPDGADRALDELGRLLRYALRQSAEDVTLRQEWEFTRDYLGFEALRLGKRLRLETKVSPDALDAAVPPFILQPLVENAVRHGVANSPSGGDISVSIARDDGSVLMWVANTMAGGAGAEGMAGTGLQRLRERLALKYAPGTTLVEVATGTKFAVSVRLPWQPAGPQE
jgi:signal transduction histidine kinase